MNFNECKYCFSLDIKQEKNNFYCISCNRYYYLGTKKLHNNVKNFSNKEAHFKNIIKSFNNINNIDFDKNLILDIKKIIEDKNIKKEFIDTQFIIDSSKKLRDKTKKNYLISFFILSHIKNENPLLDNNSLNIINIIFYDFINFLSKNNKIDTTISYQLIINNILTLFNISNNLMPNIKNNIKDKKYDLWNKYIIDVCKRKLINKPIYKKIIFNPIIKINNFNNNIINLKRI